MLFGIQNCDTVKKARASLLENGIEHSFHDFKKDGVPAAELQQWALTPGWQSLLNRQGTTWRKLDPLRQAQINDAASACALMLDQPSVIRRPVGVWSDGRVTVGFEALRLLVESFRP